MMAQTMGTRGSGTALAATVLLVACASTPEGSYYASPTQPATARVSHILYRAAVAAGDDPQRYGFAFIKSPTVAAYSDEDATFYFTDGLMRQPDPVVEAVVAHEVAHEVMGHVGTRRKLSLSLTASFGALGLFVPGAGLLDFVVNPLVVRAFGRQQELKADQKAVEILRAMGQPAPRRTLANALETIANHTPREKEGLEGLLATHPTLDDRLAALTPLEAPAKPAPRPAASPVARAKPPR
jgi:Zn-dependent protease with chaperone function